jgi:hypothetical protein
MLSMECLITSRPQSMRNNSPTMISMLSKTCNAQVKSDTDKPKSKMPPMPSEQPTHNSEYAASEKERLKPPLLKLKIS